jgi:DNA-binding protein YbaB
MSAEPADDGQDRAAVVPDNPTGGRVLGRSPNDLVAVVVGADGLPEQLSIKPPAMRLPADELAAEILGALHAAHNDSFQQMLQRFEDLPSGVQSPDLRNATATAEQARADVTRMVERVTDEFDAVRRKLHNLMGGTVE